MNPLYEAIIDARAPPPDVDPDGPFQMRISQLDYNSYVGIIGIGRIQRGTVRTNMPVAIIDREGKKRNGKVLQVLGFMGLERREVPRPRPATSSRSPASRSLSISDTVCALDTPERCRR